MEHTAINVFYYYRIVYRFDSTSKMMSQLLSREFIKGFIIGGIVVKMHCFIQDSLNKNYDNPDDVTIAKKIHDKIESYDTNKDSNVSPGELLDGVIKDVIDLKHVANHPIVEPNAVFKIDSHHDAKENIVSSNPSNNIAAIKNNKNSDENQDTKKKYVDPDRYDPKIIVFL